MTARVNASPGQAKARDAHKPFGGGGARHPNDLVAGGGCNSDTAAMAEDAPIDMKSQAQMVAQHRGPGLGAD